MPARVVLLGYTVHVQRPSPSKGVDGHVDVPSGGKRRLEALGEFIQQEVLGYVHRSSKRYRKQVCFSAHGGFPARLLSEH